MPGYRLALASVSLVFFLAACTAPASAPSEPIAPLESAVFAGNCTLSGPLRVYNWFEYMDPAVLTQFGERYGIEVTEELYGSNEEMINTLKEKPGTYDLIFPGGFAVPLLIEEGLIQELDRENIPNEGNLSTVLRPLYDTLNRYSMPYQWGITGIAYNASYFDKAPDSWAYFFEPELAGAHEGTITMLDDKRETLAAALIYLGYSVNDTNPGHLEEARDLLLSQQPYLAGYVSEGLTQQLIEGEIQLAHNWNGYTAAAGAQNPDIKFIVPKEGAVMFLDKVAIPTDAPNKCTAELFINYILDPQIAAQISNFTLYNPPVPAASAFLNPAAQAMLELSYNSETFNDLQVIEHPTDPTTYDSVWQEVKGGLDE
ncbi:MAG: spermidine/putrescine ABC transporter substrate-binding protein [Ardenticatenales bacterium]|nr:spermidine/putrescine ABC transporter substrate-binding protein [Ardenticatenales bacterium]